MRLSMIRRLATPTAVVTTAVFSFASLASGEGDPPDGSDLPQTPLYLDLTVEPAQELGPFDFKAADADYVWGTKPEEEGDVLADQLDEDPGYGDMEAAGSNDVGVIPEKPYDCPPGSEYVVIHTDDEDKNNNSNTSGWTGVITHEGSGTTFGFCRVDGNLFRPVPGASYGVLSLGNCPAGSFGASHQFDNENRDTANWSVGNISPSYTYNGYVSPYAGDTNFSLCVFPAAGGGEPLPLSSHFPDLGVPYGVFADQDLPFWLASGHVHTDDEDTSGDWNRDIESGTWSWNLDISAYIYETYGQHRKNSELDIAKIWAGPPCLQPCPLPGSWYDGANCWVATPPAGTTPFTYAGNLYYSPVYVPSCPVAGSAYDGANCYIQTPSGTTPFVWNGNLYYSPQPGPSCPVAGSAYDGANCYIATPSGTTPFVWNGDLYYSPVQSPTCPMPGSAYDGANCYVATPPACTTPFVYMGHLYYSPVCH